MASRSTAGAAGSALRPEPDLAGGAFGSCGPYSVVQSPVVVFMLAWLTFSPWKPCSGAFTGPSPCRENRAAKEAMCCTSRRGSASELRRSLSAIVSSSTAAGALCAGLPMAVAVVSRLAMVRSCGAAGSCGLAPVSGALGTMGPAAAALRVACLAAWPLAAACPARWWASCRLASAGSASARASNAAPTLLTAMLQASACTLAALV
mmetsp:Transcript_103260/g.274626  ORF Transcript_103260/g.274626 Transcript_103260/m.274626 type:complete len:206 (+) Transcript_103260:105-722(+)